MSQAVRILAIDTTTEACSVALYRDGQIRLRHVVAPRRHTELVLPMIDELLSEVGMPLSALDALAFGCGPGSFTGVRIATGVVQGLSYGAGLSVVPISDLAALAQQAIDIQECGSVLASLDARMGEVYWARYQAGADGLAVLADEEYLTPIAALPAPRDDDSYRAGSGWGVYQTGTGVELVSSGVDATMLPGAAEIARLAAVRLAAGEAVAPDQALPVYMRPAVRLNH